MATVFAFDTETKPIAPGCCAPPMACLTYQSSKMPAPAILHASDPAAYRLMRTMLESPGVCIVGQYVAYDMCVCAAKWPDLIPLIFDAYAADRVTDTKIREQLFDIALGIFRGYADERGVWRKNSYHLDDIARRRTGMALKKDGWRMRYGEFIDVPLSRWVEHAKTLMAEAQARIDAGVKDKDLEAIAAGRPEEVIEYPLRDAEATLRVYQAQEAARAKEIKEGIGDPFVDQFRQVRASFWLALMSNWGLRTHWQGYADLERATIKRLDELTDGLVTSGLVRRDGSRDTKAATQRMLEVMGWRVDGDGYKRTRDDARPLRKTKGGGISLDRDACKESDDELLEDYGERAVMKAVQDKDLPMLLAGISAPVHSRFDIVASGRTSSSKPNIQNLRRLVGIRECFIPRDGKVFAQADYPTLELRTLAQACYDLLGHSRLGDMINRGEDPHLAFAAELRGMSYEEAKKNKKRKDVDDARQIGKVFNFGSPGGLGAEKLCQFARKTYGVTIEVEQAKKYKQAWLATFPEMRDYFAHVSRLTDNPRKEARVLQLRSGRIRGGCTYTAACNTYFQGLGADAAKAAGFAITRACYTDRKSPLFGSRLVCMIHDEFILEVTDNDRAHDAAFELARIMKVEANKWLPDCPFVDVEPQLMRLWSKEAEPLYHPETKRLVPWEPELAAFIKLGEAVAARPSLKVAA